MTTVAGPASATAEANALPRTRTKNRTKSRNRNQSIRTIVQAIVIVLWCLLPFYWMVVTSFRDIGYTNDNTPWFTHVTLDNYVTALSTNLGNHLGQALLNSLFIGICVTVISLIVGIFASYALARLDFKFKGVVLGVILAASMFPGVAPKFFLERPEGPKNVGKDPAQQAAEKLAAAAEPGAGPVKGPIHYAVSLNGHKHDVTVERA